MIWRLSSPGALYDCNENTVVYFDPASGNTHLLSDFAGHIIQSLATKPLSTDQIADGFADHVAADDLQGVIDVIPDVLTELRALDIVEAL